MKMKKINILLISLFAVIGFYSCQKDEIVTINPAAENGTLTFVLNKTQYENYTFVLDEANNAANMDALTAQQPDYGFTAAVTYYIQASFKADMTDSVELASSVQGENVAINVKDMNKAIKELYNDNMPNPSVVKDVYVRLRAIVSTSTATPLITTPTVKPAYSNIVKLNVLPYYVPSVTYYYEAKVLKPYYIIGLGDGAWKNDPAGLGVSVIPMSVVNEKVYNTEGQGIWKFTGYFEVGKGFKLIRDIGSWNEQWGCSGGDITKPLHNDGGSSDFKVPASGYYTITLNSITNDLKIEASSKTPTVYNSMGIIGEFNGWGGDDPMMAFQTMNNHVWYKNVTFAANGNYLFRANGSWDLKFGSPSAVGNGDAIYQNVGLGILGGGKDILETAGSYVLIMNDIDGCYYAIKK